MPLYHIVSLPDGQQVIVRDNQITAGQIKQRVYDEDHLDDYYMEWVAVEIDCSYLVEITARFIMNPEDGYKSPMYRSAGMRNINHLAYTYSINIMEHVGSYTLYGDTPMYSKTGIGTTQFDMYAYHQSQGSEYVYPTDRIEYEVESNLDLRQILLPDQD